MRRRRFVITLLILALFFGVCAAWVGIVTPGELSKRKEINSGGFNHIRNTSNWDLNDDMLWGYYFINGSKFPLVLISWFLPVFGYRTVDITERKENKMWWLHSERIQTNTLDSLSTRDVRFQRLAKLAFNSDYDGWDVGPTPNGTKQ